MINKPINLVQQPGSPREKAVAELFSRQNTIPNLRIDGPPLPAEALAAPSLWLWDTHGFTLEQVEDLGRDLQPDHLGVMVICSQADDLVNRAVRLSGAIQLVACPAEPGVLASALMETERIQTQIADLLTKREEVRQDIADRMLVEDAKRLVMVEMDKSEPEAMRYLQNLSRRLNQKLPHTAQMILGAENGDKP